MSQIEEGALTAEQKRDLYNRLARIEGQLRGVQKLIQIAVDPSDTNAAIQQMAAARKSLDRAFVQLMAATMRTQGSQSDDLGEARATVDKLAAMLEKYL